MCSVLREEVLTLASHKWLKVLFMDKILFVGDLNSWGRCHQRHRALVDLGYEVKGLSSVPEGRVPGISGKPSLWVQVRCKIGIPPDETGINDKIIEAVRDFRPDLLWVEKGLMIKPRTLKESRAIDPNMKLAFYSEDDMSAKHNQSFFFRHCLPLYNIVFTTKSYNCNSDELPALGARRVVFVDKAYDKHTHRPVPVNEADKWKFGADVGFIGTFDQDRAEKMLYLAENGIPIRIWGNGWKKWVNRHPNLQIENRPIYGDEYVKALCATKINLGFLRKINRDLQTDRTMEIPACEAFMLAERTGEHLRLFKEGKEAEFFDSKEELLKKVKYYLEHEEERKAIAKAGRERCLNSGYSHHDRLKYMLSKIEEEL